jgi:hypothetical protein
VHIAFIRRGEDGCVSALERPDGVRIEMRGYSRTHLVPHDLAHAVTERALGMDRGVYGTIAGGGLFASVTVIGGRPRHDAAARSVRILRANGPAIGVAEVLSGLVHRAVESDRSVTMRDAREAWGVCSADPFPWAETDLTLATACLRALADEWNQLVPGEQLALGWPRRLISAIPPAPRINDRSRVRRRSR